VLRVSAVSYLNTAPLVWGFQNGPDRGLFNIRFELPAQCAAALESGTADIGLLPSAELDRLHLDFLPDLGIACEGPVRSILLISRKPLDRIQTLAADSSSRTSIALARILLAEKHSCQPVITLHPPRLKEMIAECDAALIIGDPALHLDLATLRYHTLDLGEEWVKWSGLPMVFAVWAGRTDMLTPAVRQAFRRSYEWGKAHINDIIADLAVMRGFDAETVRKYLTQHIRYELKRDHLRGLELFRQLARKLSTDPVFPDFDTRLSRMV
jgi:chorismate dehydratase